MKIVSMDAIPRGDGSEHTRPRRTRRERAEAAREPIRPLGHRWYLACKRLIDLLVALPMSLIALPVVGMAALAVRLTSRGPAFYTQTRVGLGGQLFTIVKIRTMIHNCESLTGPRWSIPGDPRVTAIGAFLRKTHLDELPQLWNVLKGDMSLIGPRPERPEFVPELARALPAYRQRLNVRPGVTGLAQVQLPADSSVATVRRKLAYDLYYIRHLSVWLDARLMASTALYALGLSPRVIRACFGLPARDTVEEGVRDVVGYQIPERAARPAA